MSCVDRIVTLGICPDEAKSTSGFTLVNAAGISIKGLAQITNDNHVRGTSLAMDKKEISIAQVRSDMLGVMQLNNVLPQSVDEVIKSADFFPNISMGTFPGERGVVLHKAGTYKGRLRKTRIRSVDLFPLASGSGMLRIYDGKVVRSWPVDLVANQVNTFDDTNLSNFPYVLPDDVAAVKVLIDQTTIPFASAEIVCLKTCGGRMPNPCGWVDGWDGLGNVRAEGYGVNVNFSCDCDYDQILCDMAKTFTGELIWLKWQYNIFDEQYKSNRFSNWVIYNQEKIKEEILPDLESKYNQKFNEWAAGLYEILRSYRDECLNCRGSRWVVNF